MLFLIGLPIVVIIAYAFEHPEVCGAHRRRWHLDAALGWFDWTLFGACFVIIGLAVASSHDERAARLSSSSRPADAAPDASVTVLPFVNFSSSAANNRWTHGGLSTVSLSSRTWSRAHLHVLFRGQRGLAGDRPQARHRTRARRQRAQRRRSLAHHGAAHQGRGQVSPVVGDL